MNKLLKNVTPILFFLLSINLSAQIQYELTPANSTQITAAIFDDFQHLISISPIQLKGHLESLSNPTIYCASCPNTDLNIQENGPNSLDLNWEPVPNAHYYEIDYINLATGISNNIMVNGTSHLLSSISNGPYAFSISTYTLSNNGDLYESKVHIIVEETPILMEDLMENCNCPFKTPEPFTLVGNELTWYPMVNTRYAFDITFIGGNHPAMELIVSTASGTNGLPLNFRLECQEALAFSRGSNTFFPAPDTFDLQLHFNHSGNNYHLTFHGHHHLIDVIDLNSCTPPPPGRERDGNRLISTKHSINNINIHPNPVQDKLWITVPNGLEQSTSISIYNQMGQQMMHGQLQTAKEFIDINNWPRGTYSIQFKSADEFFTKSFIKIN